MYIKPFVPSLECSNLLSTLKTNLGFSYMAECKTIAIEGIDGSGKGTQHKLLSDYLKSKGIKFTTFSFPRYSETFFGKMVGEYLNGEFGGLGDIDPRMAAILFAGDRFETLETINKAIQENDIVLMDRYVGSNLAHQSAKVKPERRKEFIDWLSTLEYEVYHLPKEDLVIYLKIDPGTAQTLVDKKSKRAYTDKKRDIYESSLSFLKESIRQFDYLAENYKNWRTVESQNKDGSLKSPESISSEIIEMLEDESII